MMDLTIGEIAAACGGKLVLCGEQGEKPVSCGNGENIAGASAAPGKETPVRSVVIDSRLAEPQGVFIATVGERVDGHRFIPSVFEKGAVLAVSQKTPEQVKAEHGVSSQWGCYILVEDTLQALKDIAEAYRKKLSAKVVGITGSVGKTSTKEFIAGVLAEKFKVLKTEGNFNNEIGVPLTLLRIRPEHEIAVVEMGISEFGEMHRLSKMARPDVCVITNIGQSHLNNLINRDGILRAKSEIFDFMAENGEICLYGGDDKLAPLREIRGRRPHFYGLGDNPAEEVIMTDIIGRGLTGSDAVLKMKSVSPVSEKEQTQNYTGDEKQVQEYTGNEAQPQEDTSGDMESLQIHIPLPGVHMALNAAAAACVAKLFGMTAEEIAAGIGKTGVLNGRTHIISMPRYTLIDDCYNANPASVKAAIDLLALADTKKVAILGDMLNLGENTHEYHAEVGRHAAEAGVDCLVCVGEESLYTFHAAEACEKAPGHISHFTDRDALLEGLRKDCESLIPEGSTVLIKASHDMGFAKLLEFLQNTPLSGQNSDLK